MQRSHASQEDKAVDNKSQLKIAAKRLRYLCVKQHTLTDEEHAEALRIIQHYAHCPEVVNAKSNKKNPTSTLHEKFDRSPVVLNALNNQRFDIAQALLAAPAIDVSITGYHQRTILQYAIMGTLTQEKLPNPIAIACVEAIMQRPECDYNAKDNSNYSALHFAANAHIDLMLPLLDKPKIDINTIIDNRHTKYPDHRRRTVLSDLIRHVYILSSRFPLNAPAYRDTTERILRKMIAMRGFRVDEKIKEAIEGSETPRTLTALHLAAAFGLDYIVSILLEAGANPKLRDSKDNTAIQLAVQYRRESCAQIIRNFAHHPKAPAPPVLPPPQAHNVHAFFPVPPPRRDIPANNVVPVNMNAAADIPPPYKRVAGSPVASAPH